MNKSSAIIASLVVGLLVGGLMGYLLGSGKANLSEVKEEASENVGKIEDKMEKVATGAGAVVVAQWWTKLGEQNQSGETGIATLTEQNGQTKVVVTLVAAPGASVSASQPAHIHLGSCPNPGEVKYPLTNVVKGISETVLPVTIAQLKAMMPLAINVHKSAEEVKVYTACGDLK